MPSVVWTVNWNSGLAGWADGFGAGRGTTWFAGDGEPGAGCLKMTAFDFGSGSSALLWARTELSGITWETFGVPNGQSVNSVTGSIQVKRVTDTGSFQGSIRVHFIDPSRVPARDLPLDVVRSSGLLALTPNVWTQISSGGATAPPAAFQASTTPLTLEIYVAHQVVTPGDVEYRIDTLSLTITYGEPPAPPPPDPEPDPGNDPGGGGLPGAPCCNFTERTLPAGLATHLQGDCLTLAGCLKLTRSDGTVLGFTTHDRKLTVSSVDYEPAPGLELTAIRQELGSGVDNLELASAFLAGSVTDADLRAGRYDGAALELFVVNWANVSDGVLTLAKGTLGDLQLEDGRWAGEFRSLTQRLQGQVVEVTTPLCRVRELGDSRCAPGGTFADDAVLADYQFSRTVTAVTDPRQMTFGADNHATGYYLYGRVTFTSGLNDGLTREIKRHTLTSGEAVLELYEAFPFTVQVGDTATLEAGCDRRLTTCRDRFANVLNFRGEPDLPGRDGLRRRGRRD